MIPFRTGKCGKFGHPEVSFQFAEPAPVPGLERILLEYFERSVAAGVKFAAGQKIGFGGSILVLFDRGDGSLGVRDVGADGKPVAPESVHRTLMRTWCRQEVARSFDLDVQFPAPHQRVIVCSRVEASKHALLLKRAESTEDDDSGWYVGCTDDTHDHDAPDALDAVYLLQVSERYAWLDQFFALPTGTDLVVEMDGRVAVPVLWRSGGPPVAPKPGTYVAALNLR